MRNYLLVFTFFVFSASSAQALHDSLSKYSYLIQTKDKELKTQSTGFFVRYGSRLFFITAAHCLTGWDPIKFQKIENLPDTVFVRLSNDTSKLAYLPIPIVSIKKTSQPFHEYESPDVCVVEIKNPKKYRVYSIEQFFDEQVQCDLAKEVSLYGYPVVETYSDYLRDRQQPFTSTAALNQQYCVHTFLPDVKVNDPVNYYTYIKEGSSGPGYSGAPAYLMTQNNTIAFGGIYIGGTAKPVQTAIVVRPEYVIDKIISKIRD